MSTDAQILANQKNAQASTGPRTPEGKERSSQNAIKYGVTSRQVVLPCEDAAEFDAMHNAWIDQLAPGHRRRAPAGRRHRRRPLADPACRVRAEALLSN